MSRTARRMSADESAENENRNRKNIEAAQQDKSGATGKILEVGNGLLSASFHVNEAQAAQADGDAADTKENSRWADRHLDRTEEIGVA